MKAIEVKAWACGGCHKLFPFNDIGKIHANSCCMCRIEGCNNRTEYTGRNNICRPCHAKECLPGLKEQAERCQKDYEQALKDFERMNKKT